MHPLFLKKWCLQHFFFLKKKIFSATVCVHLERFLSKLYAVYSLYITIFSLIQAYTLKPLLNVAGFSAVRNAQV